MGADYEKLKQARELLETIRRQLLSVVDPRDTSTKSKIPYKVACYREGLGRRIEELGRCACDSYESGDIATAVTLTRAATETAAAAWYLKDLIERQLSDGFQEDLDDKVMALLMGHRNVDDMPQAVNILSMVDRIDKLIDGFRKMYDVMSEVAHPNWSGTQHLFSKIDTERRLTFFGRDVRTISFYERTGASCLFSSLMIFDHCHGKVTDAMPQLIKLCEEHLASKG